MPPGPPGLPLLGNALQIGDLQWLQFTKWKEQYGKLNRDVLNLNMLNEMVPPMLGSIFSIHLAGQPVVVLNDFTTAADLLGECAYSHYKYVSHVSSRCSLEYLQ